MPRPVLRILLLSLHSLQHFPDERCLHVQCDEGTSTVIVWCYHILGLDVSLSYKDRNIAFGTGSPSVFLQQNQDEPCYATLLHPGNKDEPLFRLSPEMGQRELLLEPRKRTRGFGIEMIRQHYIGEHSAHHVALCAIHHALQSLEDQTEAKCQKLSSIPLSRKEDRLPHRSPTYETEMPGIAQNNIIHAAKMLFNLESVDEIVYSKRRDWSDLKVPEIRQLVSQLGALLLSLACVHTEDLQTCGDLPLLNDVWKGIKNNQISIPDFGKPKPGYGRDFDVCEAFTFLSIFLEGPGSWDAKNRGRILTSACGWSLFFGAVSVVDPWDARMSTLRIVRGVPVRDGIRKERICDGPRSFTGPPLSGMINARDLCDTLAEGSRQIVRGPYLYGCRGSDTFEVTQTFHCNDRKAKGSRSYVLGFRQMVDLCSRFTLIPPCHCDGKSSGFQKAVEETMQDAAEVNNVDPKDYAWRDFLCYDDGQRYSFSKHGDLSEHWRQHQDCNNFSFFKRVVSGREGGDLVGGNPWYGIHNVSGSFGLEGGVQTNIISSFFNVTENPAARWVQLWRLHELKEQREYYPTATRLGLFLRGRDACVQCAVEAIVPKSGQPSPYVSIPELWNVACVVL